MAQKKLQKKASRIEVINFSTQTSYLSYSYGGKEFWAQGDFFRRKSGRFEHTHITPRGRLITFTFE